MWQLLKVWATIEVDEYTQIDLFFDLKAGRAFYA